MTTALILTWLAGTCGTWAATSILGLAAERPASEIQAVAKPWVLVLVWPAIAVWLAWSARKLVQQAVEDGV